MHMTNVFSGGLIDIYHLNIISLLKAFTMYFSAFFTRTTVYNNYYINKNRCLLNKYIKWTQCAV